MTTQDTFYNSKLFEDKEWGYSIHKERNVSIDIKLNIPAFCMLWTDDECWCAKHNIQQNNKTVVHCSEYLYKKNLLSLVHTLHNSISIHSPAICRKYFTSYD